MQTEMGQTSEGDVGSSSNSKRKHDEVVFLDYLSTDFSYLRRFVLAAEQMIWLLQSETARSDGDVQEKIAKETLTEAGASARPFVSCPPHLAFHRQAYLNMLSAARSLVPHVKDAHSKLRLRRLILPLTSTSRFRVALAKEGSPLDGGAPLPTWWNKSSGASLPQAGASSATTLEIMSLSRKRMRRSPSVSPKSFAIQSTTTPKSRKAPAHESDRPPVSSSFVSTLPSQIPNVPLPSSAPDQPLSQHRGPKRLPSAHSKSLFSSGSSQRRDLGPGYAAFQKSLVAASSSRDWNVRNRPSLGGLNPNLPSANGGPQNGSAGSAWGGPTPLMSRTWSETGGVPTPSPGLTWCTSWDDAGPRKVQGAGSSMAAVEFFGETTSEKSLTDPTCTSEYRPPLPLPTRQTDCARE
ncbi:hypothetical protein M0805_007934 [Coniferiporia weirii]|nr:hypothetical protein M0805_007934 [Coniferiporia weirii]